MIRLQEKVNTVLELNEKKNDKTRANKGRSSKN